MAVKGLYSTGRFVVALGQMTREITTYCAGHISNIFFTNLHNHKAET